MSEQTQSSSSSSTSSTHVGPLGRLKRLRLLQGCQDSKLAAVIRLTSLDLEVSSPDPNRRSTSSEQGRDVVVDEDLNPHILVPEENSFYSALRHCKS